jgi:hypothetical protein
MLIVVLVIAIIGIVVLAAAIMTGSTVIALVVIALAAVGLVLLARDWWGDRSRPPSGATQDSGDDDEHEAPGPSTLTPDRFEPDIPYENGAEAAESEQRADPAVDGNDSTGDVGAGAAGEKH